MKSRCNQMRACLVVTGQRSNGPLFFLLAMRRAATSVVLPRHHRSTLTQIPHNVLTNKGTQCRRRTRGRSWQGSTSSASSSKRHSEKTTRMMVMMMPLRWLPVSDPTPKTLCDKGQIMHTYATASRCRAPGPHLRRGPSVHSTSTPPSPSPPCTQQRPFSQG